MIETVIWRRSCIKVNIVRFEPNLDNFNWRYLRAQKDFSKVLGHFEYLHEQSCRFPVLFIAINFKRKFGKPKCNHRPKKLIFFENVDLRLHIGLPNLRLKSIATKSTGNRQLCSCRYSKCPRTFVNSFWARRYLQLKLTKFGSNLTMLTFIQDRLHIGWNSLKICLQIDVSPVPNGVERATGAWNLQKST